MKKLYLAVFLASSLFFTSAQSMLQIIFGAGLAGLGGALYRETASDNTSGAIREAAQMAAMGAGCGTPLEKLRFNIQNNLRNVISEHRRREGAVENFNFLLRVEKILYGSAMVLGGILTLYGLKDFFQSK